MGVINWIAFGGVLVDLVIISIIISNTFWGYRRGLVGVMFKILVFIVSLIIMFVLYKPMSNAIISKTQIDEWLAEKIAQNIQGTTLADGELLEYNEEITSMSEGVVNVLNSFVSEALDKSVTNVVEYVSTNIAVGMIRIGSMLILLMLSRFLLLFIRFAAELVGSLPFIRTFNKSGGLIYGILKGFLTVYIILAVFAVASPIIQDWGVIDSIQDSTLGSKMYNNNVITNVIFKK